MVKIGQLGGDEGHITGPRPGDGASSVGGMIAGGSDMEGTPGDALPPRRIRGDGTAGIRAFGVPQPVGRGMLSFGSLDDPQGMWLAVVAAALTLLALWMLLGS